MPVTENCFCLANSVDPGDMPHFILVFAVCTGIQNEKGLIKSFIVAMCVWQARFIGNGM